jgi:hypothetical protein
VTEAQARALFLLAGFEVLSVYKTENRYWLSGSDRSIASPWWLVRIDEGIVVIGWRKRVIAIDWSDTTLRGVVTPDDVTKDDTMVHAWRYSKAVEYLDGLRALRPHRAPAPAEVDGA